jgi:ATP-dependent DNA ligase
MIASPHGRVNAIIRGPLPDFFEVACAHDLEGIVGKLAGGRYHADGTSTNWCKIKNRGYTQMTARHERFESRRGEKLTRRKVPLPAL